MKNRSVNALLAALAAIVFSGASPFRADTIRHMADTYLKSDGSQFIDTGLYITTNMSIQVEFEPEIDNIVRYLFGSYGDGSTMAYGLFLQNGKICFCHGTRASTGWSNSADGGAITAQGRYKVTYDLRKRSILMHAGDSWQFNNWGVKLKDPGIETNNCTLGIFGNHITPSRAVDLFKCKLYSFRVFEKGALIRDFVPYGRGAVTGLLDRCSGKVHVNSMGNANPFVLGTDDGYVRSWLAKRGGQFLNTGYTATPATKIEVDFSMADISTVQQRIFGADKGAGLCCGLCVNGNKQFAWAFHDDLGNWQTTGVTADGARRTFTLDAPNGTVTLAKAGGAVEYSGTIGTAATKNGYTTLRLFGNATTNGTGAVTLTDPASVRIYRMRIWNGGTLVRDYTPRIVGAQDGLYDNANASFYTSDLSGTSNTGKYRLTAGGAIEAVASGSDSPTDAYLESYGSQAIDTGCLLSLQSKLEIDASLLDFGGTTYLFGTGAGGGHNGLYHQNATTRSMLMCVRNASGGNNWPWLANNLNQKRIRVAMDFANAKATMSTPWGNSANLSLPTGTLGDTARLWVMARNGGDRASMRLYAFRIYDGVRLIHDYVPCAQGGVAGVWDTVDKEFRANQATADGSGFTVCGAGVNGSGMTFAEEPQGSRITRRETATLSAFAPGAVSYQWYKNGELMEGAVGRTIEAGYRKSNAVDTYQCVAHFNIFGYAVSSEAQVASLPDATVMVVR